MEHENLNNHETAQLGIGEVMPRSCPFCGNKAQFRDGHEHCYIGGYDITIYLECSHCLAEMSTSYGMNGKKETTKDEAKKYLIDSWNARNGA